MAGQDWSIRIVATDGVVQFTPARKDAQPGQPLQASTDDLVSWNNKTGEPHWPWPTDSSYTPMSDEEAMKEKNWLSEEIPPQEPSTPAYICGPPGTIYYCCKLHPQERGKIIVNPA